MGRHIGVMNVTNMLPADLQHLAGIYISRAHLMGQDYSYWPGVNGVFNSLVSELFQTEPVGGLGFGSTIFDYDPGATTTRSWMFQQGQYPTSSQFKLSMLADKGRLIQWINQGKINVRMLPDKQLFVLTTFEAFRSEVCRYIDTYGGCYVQLVDSDGGFGSAAITRTDDPKITSIFKSARIVGHLVIAPLGKVIKAPGIGFTKKGAIGLNGNLIIPGGDGSSQGTYAPVINRLTVEQKADANHQGIQLAHFVNERVPNLSWASGDILLIQVNGREHLVTQEINARYSQFYLVAMGLYRVLHVKQLVDCDFHTFCTRLTSGSSGYAVIGNDNIKLDKERSFESVIALLSSNGIPIFDGVQNYGVIPTRDVCGLNGEYKVGFIVVYKGQNGRDVMAHAAKLYERVVTILGGNGAYRGEADYL